MPTENTIPLKGVIPPKLISLEEQLEAIRDLREFLRQFPGLAEEVMKEREHQQEHSPAC